MIQTEVLARVFRIRTGICCGTAFTLENKGVQYLITAKHLFEHSGYPKSAEIELFQSGAYKKYKVNVYYHTNVSIDVAVLHITTNVFVSQAFINENSIDKIALGQDVYFLGFPYEFDQLICIWESTSNPMPFVKKACLSGMSKDHNTIFLDGINNPGFSGGPVCYKKIGSDHFDICGVINSYRVNVSNLHDNKGKQMDYYVKGNSGIINACNIAVVDEIINSIC